MEREVTLCRDGQGTWHGVAGAEVKRSIWDKAMQSGGKLNSRAVTWTAASVALQAVATVLGRFAML